MKKFNPIRLLAISSVLAASSLFQPVFTQSAHADTQAVTVNTAVATKPFPHFWEHMFGSCRTNLSLRDSYREDLRKTKSIVDIGYVRCHGIFNDDMGIYDEDKDGKPIYNWTLVDQAYDGYLNNGVRPFVELSFMPNKLAKDPKNDVFWYKGNSGPPKDYAKWGELVYQLAKHCIERYGVDEVSKWYFECWNEPNIDFWTGVPKESTYFQLYDATARAVKRADPRLRVGGPSTAQAAWVDKTIEHCISNNIPLDFVSTHVYANDTAENVLGTKETISRKDMVTGAMKKVFDQVKASKRPDMPIIWSEFNASFMNEPKVTDAAYMGPWLANLASQGDGLANEVSYWTFSDVFEEQGVAKTPFYGGYGLIATGSIPKAAFNAMKLLHLLGEQRIPCSSDSVLATKRADGTIVCALWNYAEPDDAGTHRTINLKLDGVAPNSVAQVYTVDRDHGSAFDAWKKLGSPAWPSREEQKSLRQAAALPPPTMQSLGSESEIKVELDPFALALVIIPKNPAFHH